jgi:hypothetical protein
MSRKITRIGPKPVLLNPSDQATHDFINRTMELMWHLITLCGGTVEISERALVVPLAEMQVDIEEVPCLPKLREAGVLLKAFHKPTQTAPQPDSERTGGLSTSGTEH